MKHTFGKSWAVATVSVIAAIGLSSPAFADDHESESWFCSTLGVFCGDKDAAKSDAAKGEEDKGSANAEDKADKGSDTTEAPAAEPAATEAAPAAPAVEAPAPAAPEAAAPAPEAPAASEPAAPATTP